MIYGLWADEKPEVVPLSKPKEHWPDNHARTMFQADVLCVHQKIVELQDFFKGGVDIREISRSLGYSQGTKSFRAIINLDMLHFDTRPLNSERVVRLARRLRMIDVKQWYAIIVARKSVLNEVEIKNEPKPW